MPTSLEDLCDANFLEFIRVHAKWQDPCELVEEDGLMLVAGPNAFPAIFRNSAVRVDPRLTAEEVLARAREFFRSRKRGFTVITRDNYDEDIATLLPAAGLKPAGDSPCMLIESPLQEPTVPGDVRVERFREVRHVLDAVAINAEAYQAIKLPPNEARIYFGRPEKRLAPNVEGFVAYREGQPVSTALVLFSGDSAGLYWIGTAGAAQRRGLAEICTRLATNAGFARGVKVVTLQASPFGEPIYKRLGYRVYDRMRQFMELPPKK